MGQVITFGIQKGGCGKSTTTGALAYIMAQEQNRVLAIDMDSQGNLTELLTRRPANDFIGRSVFEAIVEQDAKSYIVKADHNIDVLPANNYLALFSRWLYTQRMYDNTTIPFTGSPVEQLERLLAPIKQDYDYIVIDTPPALSEQTTNALYASDAVVIMFECSNWCLSALPNFLESLNFAGKRSPNHPKILGILRTLTDARRNDAKLFNELVAEDYPDLCFDTVIRRKAPIGRLSLLGFEENDELAQALEGYQFIYGEIIERLKGE